MKYIIFFIIFFFMIYGVGCELINEKKKQPVKVIFDSDIGPDYDDVGAIAVLHALADHGEAEILATIASNGYEGVASVMNIFNTYFKKPDIPIGVPTGDDVVNNKDSQGWSDSIRAKYPHSIKSNLQVPDAVAVYRKILSGQRDLSVTIVTVGFLTNMAELLNSRPDKYSKLTGVELVRRKVDKLVCMAGSFPEGREYNVYSHTEAAKTTVEKWPTKIIFSGFEIGKEIKTGLPLINNKKIRRSPVKDVYSISIPKSEQDHNGRMSWDQTAVLVAVRGKDPHYELIEGRILINDDGSNTWNIHGTRHFYLVPKTPPGKVTQLIDSLMQHRPRKW